VLFQNEPAWLGVWDTSKCALQGLPDLPDDANAPCSVSPSLHFEVGHTEGILSSCFRARHYLFLSGMSKEFQTLKARFSESSHGAEVRFLIQFQHIPTSRSYKSFNFRCSQSFTGERRLIRVRHREFSGSDWLRVGLRIHNAKAADGSLGGELGSHGGSVSNTHIRALETDS
jgi:hypothetical protein